MLYRDIWFRKTGLSRLIKLLWGWEQVSNVLKQNAQENIWAKVEMSKGAVKRI
jgi:hypothetical protein